MTNKIYIFDIGNVVINVDESSLPFEYFSTNEDWKNFERGILSEIEFFKKYSIDVEKFTNIFTPNIFVLDLISKINSKQLYFFSNTNSCHFGCLQSKYPIFNTDNLFLSYEIGMRKPEFEFYHFIQHKSLFKKSEDIYFVDDRQENINTAKLFKWNTFLYKYNNEELVEFLK